MKNKTRDDEIIRRYVSGEPLQTLCDEYKLSRARIYQILRVAGVERDRQPKGSDRDIFLGINVSEAVKDALRAEAARRGVSMSSLSSEMLREMLTACGYPLEAEQLVIEEGPCSSILPGR